ncbi:MAG: alpha/beta hydrolase [Christensenellales bacterium]
MLLTFFDDAPVVPCPVSTPTAEYQTVTFVSDDGATLSARYIRPVGNKRVPTVLMCPRRAGRPVRGWHHMTRFVALGYAVFALENRAEADAQTQFADAQAGRTRGAQPAHNLKPDSLGRGPGRHARDCRRRQTASACCQMRGAEPALHGRICRLCAICRAARFCPLLMGTSGMDTIAPPDAQNAVYDAASCDKKRYIYVKYIHERINAFEDRVLAFFHPMV